MAETYIRVQVDIPYTSHEQDNIDFIVKSSAELLEFGEFDMWFVNEHGEECAADNLDDDEAGK